MATSRSFQDMLNEYLVNRLLKEELVKRSYILTTIEKDNNWKGGTIPVPFKGAGASSVKFGGLTAENDIAQSQYIRGSITAYREVWGSLIFNETDLQQHNGKIPESTFLRVLSDSLDDFMDHMKMVVSFQLGSGPHFAIGLADGTAGGLLEVNRIDRFVLGQKFTLDDDNSAPVDVYVIAINVNLAPSGAQGAGTITVSLTRGGAAANISAYTAAQNTKCYYDGVWDGTTATTFVSIKAALLSAANGGSATLHGVSKLAYPFLQAVNILGSSITATNILDKIFDAYTDVRVKARGKATDVLMSLKHLGSVMKIIQTEKGPFNVVPGQKVKVTEFGWMEIAIMSVTGDVLKFVGIQEWDDDTIAFMDWSALVFRTNDFFKKRVSPDGNTYHEIRAVTGYQYICDLCLFGELQFTKPGNCGIIYGISY